MVGTQLRLRRIGREGLYLIMPMDHGVSVGPIAGIENPKATIQQVDQGGATGIVVQRGLVRSYAAAEAKAGLLIHISAGTDKAPDSNDRRLVGTVEDVVRLGGDAASLHVNLGSLTESQQLEDFGHVVSDAARLGLPVLCMMYPRGPSIKNPYDPKVVAHAARLAEELGADLVKTVYTGDPKTFRDVTSSVSIPVLVAGGPKAESELACLEMVHGAMRAGAAGVSVGRNVFQARDPRRMTEAIARILFDGATVKDAQRLLREVKA